MKQELYWVCWYKHGVIQHAVSGPFLDWASAAVARGLMADPKHYCIGKSTVEIEEESE